MAQVAVAAETRKKALGNILMVAWLLELVVSKTREDVFKVVGT